MQIHISHKKGRDQLLILADRNCWDVPAEHNRMTSVHEWMYIDNVRGVCKSIPSKLDIAEVVELSSFITRILRYKNNDQPRFNL